MNEKVNLQELTSLLSEKTGISKKEAEAFLREFFDLMEEEIVSGNHVKIRNLGLFKLVSVEERESVDVRTGNRMLIAPHSKIQFSPDVQLSRIINEPFALFEPLELDEKIAETKVPDTQEPLVETKIDRKGNKKLRKLISISLKLILLIALIGIVYLIVKEQRSQSTAVFELNPTEKYQLPDTIVTKDSVKIEVVSPPDFAIPIKTHVVAAGERLTIISLREYGNKVFWVYLYEENKTSIQNPDMLLIGSPVNIPDARKYGINKEDPESVRKATLLEETYKHSNL